VGWSTAQHSTITIGQMKAHGSSTMPAPLRSKRWEQ